jgi:RHS repeat-associated protein
MFYNALGQRVLKSGAAGNTYYAYDDGGRTLGEYGPGNAAAIETVYLGSLPIAVVTPQQHYYILADHIDTPLVVAQADGTTVWDWRNRDPFGNNLPVTSAGFPEYSHRFPGQIADLETGLIYNYFRDYDPQTGRYVQSDPIGLAGGVNSYSYVHGNPVSYNDPFGQQATTAIDTGRVGLSTIGAVCAGTGGAACAAAAAGAVGVGAYWLTDEYINPWAQPLISKAVEACEVNWDKIQKNIDHANYHQTCDRKPPENLTQCELARWNRRQAQSCFDKRQEWEERWGNSRTRDAHRRALENVKRRISNSVQDIINFCPAGS